MLFRSVSQSRYVFIITANSGYNGYDRDIFLFNGNVVYYLWNNTANTLQTSGVNYSDGNWHHVAVSTGTGGTFLYVDGNLMQSNSALTATTFTSSTQITVGRSAAANAYTGTTFASAEIDELRIWNLVRSQGEINRSRFCSFNSVQSGLMANYNFNQGVNSRSNSSTNIAFTSPLNTTYNGSVF